MAAAPVTWNARIDALRINVRPVYITLMNDRLIAWLLIAAVGLLSLEWLIRKLLRLA